jgi:hypothetical protein
MTGCPGRLAAFALAVVIGHPRRALCAAAVPVRKRSLLGGDIMVWPKQAAARLNLVAAPVQARPIIMTPAVSPSQQFDRPYLENGRFGGAAPLK